MATLEELVISLTAETSSLKAEMTGASRAVQQNTDKMDKAIEEFSKNSTKNVGFFETAMATMTGFLGSQVVLGAFNLVKDAAGFMAAEFMKGVESANAEELALTKLSNSLALNGNYSEDAARSLAAFTGEMEAATNIGDDVVAANLAILSSLTKLDAQGLKVAQKAAIDMSAAFGIDLESATRMVAKGINGNVTAFQKMGIVVQDGGTKAERLTNILQALSTTQGAAAGATQTFDGLLTKISNSWGNATEAVATSLTKNQAVVEVLKVLSDTMNTFTGNVEANNGSLKNLTAQGLIGLIDGAAAVVAAIDAITSSITFMYQATLTIVNGLAATMASTWGIFSDEAAKDAEALWEATVAASDKANAAIAGDTTLGKVTDKLLQMRDAAESGFQEMQRGANGVIAPTVAAGVAVAELTAQQTKYNELITTQAQALADNTAALGSEYTFQQEMLKLSLEQELTTKETYWALQAEMLKERQAQEQVELDAALALKENSNINYHEAQMGLARKQALDSQKLATDTKKFEEATNKERAANLDSTLGVIASLSQSSSKELAAIGKAAAISTATIDGYAAVQKALASAPPPFNFALAAAVGIATAANVSKIAGVGFNKGTDSVPGIGNRDSFPAMLTPGERVVPQKTNEDLTAFLEEARGGGLGGTQSMVIEISLKDEAMDWIEAKLIERGRLGQSLMGA